MKTKQRLLTITGLIAGGAVLAACLASTPSAPTVAPASTSSGQAIAPMATSAPTAAPAETTAGTAAETATAAPEATSTKATDSSETATTPSNGFQLYQIDPAQSEARYQVDELFFTGNRLATAVGSTQGVSGDIMIDFAQPANSKLGEITIDASQLASDESRRDNFIRNMGGLQSSQYPQVKFVPTSIEGLPDSVKVGDTFDVTINGDLTVKETTKPVTWKATIKVEDGKVSGSASTEVLMSDFGVGPIEIPLLKTEDNVKLSFDFVATQA